MNPTYLYLLTFLIPVLFLILFMNKRKEKTDFFMAETSREELIQLCVEKARSLRHAQPCRGVRIDSYYKKILQAKRMIRKKLRSEIELEEGEKWLIENFRYVYKAVFSVRFDFRNFPSVGGVPRVILLARTIVEHSLNDLTPERVRLVMEKISAVLPLEYRELTAFQRALTFAIVEQIYVLSDRLLFAERARRMAQKNNIYKNMLNKDCYLYHLIQKNSRSDSLIRLGIDEKKVRMNYNDIMMKNMLCARTLFTALSRSGEFFTPEEGVKCLVSYALLKDKYKLSEVSLNTILYYFARIADAAKKCKVSEEFAGKILVNCAEKNAVDISVVLIDYYSSYLKAIRSGAYLFEKKDVKYREKFYISSVFILSVVFAVGCYFLFRSIVIVLALYIPLFFIADKIIFELFLSIRPMPDCPKLSLKKITSEQATSVVISAFCADVNDLKEIIFRAESILDVRYEEYINCILLVDTPASDLPVSELDQALKEYFLQNCSRKDILLFLRNKTFNGKKYVANERKRGAIMALMKYFVELSTDEFYYISDKMLFNPVYFVALDTDNVVLPGGIVDMIERISHPYNKKFTILSAINRINLFSLSTYYSEKYVGQAGFEEYPYYIGSYFRAFGKDIFCGKGIVRVKEFYAALNGLFPKEKILSHDVPEGAIVGCGSGGTTFEDAPSTFISDTVRKKRWSAGDVQNLPFIFGRWKNEEGQKVRMKISPVYRFVMMKNILSLFRSFFALTLFAIGLTGRFDVLLAAACTFVFPYLMDFIFILRKITHGCNIRVIFRQIRQKTFELFEQFFMLPYYAVMQKIVFFKTVFRMLFGKNLLEWKTFSQSNRYSEGSRYIVEFLPTVILLTVSLAVAFLLRERWLFFYGAGYSVCVFMTLFMQYLMSVTKLSRVKVSENDKKVLKEVARATYSYFSFMNSDRLIADNLQVRPYKGQSSYTSITDVAFGLLAEVCAIEMGYISFDAGARSVLNQLKIIEKLPKWNGCLYNWYDINENVSTNNYVSSVDEGNFLMAVLLIREYFKGKNDNIYLLCEKCFEEADLNKLYDGNKNLFYIGFGDGSTGHYDMLCSEARILSYVYVMKHGKTYNYFSLAREYASMGDNFLLSWGGSAFEALMPELFIPSPDYSLFSVTTRSTGIIQKKEKWKGIWGVSESGFTLLDNDLHYQYKTFGLNKLSVADDTDNSVISPYSSVLCLSTATADTVRNMVKMKEMGLFGEYGFYEGIDRKDDRIVYQYLTHHQGMILCAIVNELKGGLFRKLLYDCPIGRGVCTLLNELPTTRKIVAVKNYSEPINTVVSDLNVVKNENVRNKPMTVALTDGATRVFCNANGSIFSYFENVCIQKKMPEYFESGGGFFYVVRNEKFISPTLLPFCDPGRKYDFTYDGRTAEFCSISDHISEKITVLPGLSSFVYRLSAGRQEEVYFYSDIILNKEDAYLSHPTFSDLFIYSEKISEDTVLFTRRGKNEIYLAIRLGGGKNYRMDTNRKNVVGRGKNRFEPFISEKKFTPFGDVLTPCFSVRATTGKDGYLSVCFMFGHDKAELLSAVSLLPEDACLFTNNLSKLYLMQQNTIENLVDVLYGRYESNEQKTGSSCSYNKEYFCLLKSVDDVKKYVSTYEELRLLRLFPTLVFPSVDFNDIVEKKCRQRHVDFRIVDGTFPCKRTIVFDNDYSIAKEDEVTREISLPDIDYRCGEGGFDAKGNYIVCGDFAPKNVYAYIVAGEYGGSLLTALGGGFFWFDNARENKIVRFDNEPVGENKGEMLSLRVDGKTYPLLGGYGKGRYSELGRGYFSHYVDLGDIHVKSTVSSVFDGRARIVEVSVSDLAGLPYEVEYTFFPTLAATYENKACSFEYENGILTVRNNQNGRKVYFTVVGKQDVRRKHECSLPCLLWNGDRTERRFIVCSPDKNMLLSLTEENVSLYLSAFIRKAEELTSVEVVGGSKGLENILSFLPYQIAVSRLYARTGFYQVGGAYGFRDQLQDAMAFFTRPEFLRKQILLSCAHQYEEGDVMHWWHPPKFGLRTRITDDKLFLPLAVYRYITVSDDTDILNIEVEYVTSKPLKYGEETRFEDPPVGKKETVFKHCLRAIRSSLKYGEHKLLIMGAGDWNDGMDEVCKKGVGESVFNSMLAYCVLTKFGELCPNDIAKELLAIAGDLKNAVNKFAFDEDRYIRLFSDDGRALGGRNCQTLELDLLVQAVAVLSGVAEGERAITVLETCKKLIDYKAGIIKLLSPPQTSASRIGYISDYPPGIRENGGQYTHAAIWYLIALCRMGKQDEAYDLFCMINPAEKCKNKDKSDIYCGEPYVFSGDVYSNKDNFGVCGWSWYTGSAAWAYRLICEEFFGLKRRGNKLFIDPKLPKKLNGCTVTYRHLNSVYLIEYSFGLRQKLTVDGVVSEYVELKEGCRCSVSVEIGL